MISPKSRGRTLLTEINTGSESISACRNARFCRFANSSTLRAEMSRAMIAIPSGVAMTCWRIQRAPISASLSSHSSSRVAPDSATFTYRLYKLPPRRIATTSQRLLPRAASFARPRAAAPRGFMSAKTKSVTCPAPSRSQCNRKHASRLDSHKCRYTELSAALACGCGISLRLTGRYAAGNRASLCGSSRSVSAFTTP